MKLFETMRLENNEIKRLSLHKERIQDSCKALGINFDTKQWNDVITHILENYPNQLKRLKMMIDQQGEVSYEIAELPDKQHFTARLVQLDKVVKEQDLIHKTTHRDHLQHNHSTDLILLHDDKGKILEFDIGNVMVEEDEQWYTPEFEHDFLRGTMRRALIEQGSLAIKNYDVATFVRKLQNNEIKVFLLNSLREVADVEIYL
ncbi:aminotransferase class IV [Staphylococcus kloosii]|uniref:aminotransferase class IV n=1 Tax=Staphylococcus kloosii TaxID=29384 RepID=UPI0028A30A83|nr:aminotransferase class IV [Staphylococcus kloosii]MDT3958332.1 aminotransferase class IV [Staphylococcus kloosii]